MCDESSVLSNINGFPFYRSNILWFWWRLLTRADAPSSSSSLTCSPTCSPRSSRSEFAVTCREKFLPALFRFSLLLLESYFLLDYYRMSVSWVSISETPTLSNAAVFILSSWFHLTLLDMNSFSFLSYFCRTAFLSPLSSAAIYNRKSFSWGGSSDSLSYSLNVCVSSDWAVFLVCFTMKELTWFLVVGPVVDGHIDSTLLSSSFEWPWKSVLYIKSPFSVCRRPFSARSTSLILVEFKRSSLALSSSASLPLTVVLSPFFQSVASSLSIILVYLVVAVAWPLYLFTFLFSDAFW